MRKLRADWPPIGNLRKANRNHLSSRRFSDKLTIIGHCPVANPTHRTARAYALGVFCSIGQVVQMRLDEVTRGLLCDSKENTLTRCHGCLDRLTRWTFAFNLAACANFRVRMISVYMAYARATRIKIKIEPSFTQPMRNLPLTEEHFTNPVVCFRRLGAQKLKLYCELILTVVVDMTCQALYRLSYPTILHNLMQKDI